MFTNLEVYFCDLPLPGLKGLLLVFLFIVLIYLLNDY